LPPFSHRSPYNEHSTERSYDPESSTLNDYGASSSVTLREPSLPATGFAPGVRTVLPAQPFDLAYDPMDGMTLEIPALHLVMPIVGVPATLAGWDLTWLSNQAGYLEGTTFPTQVGTTGLTGHVYLADGTPGPFLHLGDLLWGNQVIIHANGERYIYEVRTSRVVLPSDLSVFDNDGYTWLTLLTCKEYLPTLKTYDYRLAVRAVLVKVEDEPQP
jgi:LPXTG-site transpeptidase (sortase) family protein